MFESFYKIALDGTLYALDKLLESNTEAYTCTVLAAADNHEKTGDEASPEPSTKPGSSNQAISPIHQKLGSSSHILPTPQQLNGFGGRKTKRRIIKLRLKVSNSSKDQPATNTTGRLAVDVMSPPLSPTSLASAECIPHPEYISISSKQHQQSSSSKKRLSVRTYRKQFNLSTIFEESLDEETESDNLTNKASAVTEDKQNNEIQVDLNNNSTTERGRA